MSHGAGALCLEPSIKFRVSLRLSVIKTDGRQ